jgi:MFS family permease
LRPRRDLKVGIWAVSAAIATASGPIIGGLLVDHVGWRSIFFVSLPAGAVSALVGLLIFRRWRDESRNRMLDWPRIALLSLTLMAVGWGLIDAERDGWDHSHAGSWLLTAVLVLVAFTAWERRRQPLRASQVPLGRFGWRQLSAGVVMVLTVFFALFAVLFYVTVYLQRVHGATAVEAGVRLLALSAVVGLGSVIAGRVPGRMGLRVPLLTGALLIAGGLLGLSRLESHSSYSRLSVERRAGSTRLEQGGGRRGRARELDPATRGGGSVIRQPA